MVMFVEKFLKKIYFVTLLLGVLLESGLKESYLSHYIFFLFTFKRQVNSCARCG